MTLNSALPVAASKRRPKFVVDRIAGYTPCWLGSSWSQTRAKDIVGRSERDQMSCPVLRSTQSNGPRFEPVNDMGSL